ncbi:hypothetical protein LJ207_00150 [Halanaerobium sp. Z-7514]|uniref:Uncharacterized protein n=1 Tax=Halanaerobium polyolivorans TaxID=2886943 RepID=A0AAW4WRU2_9FIRM|nr:hypothetical protein [Halanaerobium polyolivorans]MCC3143736.1 hypothetical protein [Halanaerobium polyolivorans]
MRKKFIVVGMVFILLIVLSGVTAAYSLDRVFSQMLGAKSLVYADWQMDYLVPLDPGELNKGDYRFTANVGRLEPKLAADGFLSADNNVNNFYLALDTGIRDNLYMRLSLDYVPDWKVEDYDSDHKIYNVFFDYKTESDNSLYFGYNRFKLNSEYTGDIEGVTGEDSRVNYYFVGYEMRGSFLSNNGEE